MKVTWRYRISVPFSDFDRAKKVLGIEAETSVPPYNIEEGDEEGCGDPSVELPDLPPTADFVDKERLRVSAYLKNWYPEGAIVSIWRKKSAEDFSLGLERALTENLIHFRTVSEGSEVHELFVLPEDELRARKIVREIEEATI
jgi:hypothetical protein